LVLASALLDRSVDEWAQTHQGGQWDRAASAANAVPYALALGAGMLWTGVAGDEASATAKTAVTAAAMTVGANANTRTLNYLEYETVPGTAATVAPAPGVLGLAGLCGLARSRRRR
jgi:MYXO-CTERM domain-containing protein